MDEHEHRDDPLRHQCRRSSVKWQAVPSPVLANAGSVCGPGDCSGSRWNRWTGRHAFSRARSPRGAAGSRPPIASPASSRPAMARYKGGCDPRTDGRAHDGVLEPALGRPSTRGRVDPCAALAVNVVANCGLDGSLPTPSLSLRRRGVTAAKLVEGWSLRIGAASTGRHVLAIQACPRT